MFALLIASVILPSVLGNCCQPDVLEGIKYNDYEPNRAIRTVVNYNKSKLYYEDLDRTYGDIEFDLYDIANGRHYSKYRDGTCSYHTFTADAFDTFHQCTHQGTGVGGEFTMGNGVGVASYEFKGKYQEIHLMVSTDKCLPMVMVTLDEDQEVSTSVFGNMKYTNVDDSVLDQDLSSCEMES